MAEPLFFLAGKRVWVAGHNGMVGAALLRRLQTRDCEVLTVGRTMVDLRRQDAVESWVSDRRPDVVIMAAARVGGILANESYPKDFIYDNLAIQTNIIEASYRTNVQKLLFLGSSCIYPREAPQPITEDALLTGPLEPTNQWYAIAKIAGIKVCQAYRQQHGCDYISAMPTNLYGPGDNFDLDSSHVLPALIRKMHDAKQRNLKSVTIWGTGEPRREFLHVDDCADALIFLLERYSDMSHVNVGSGTDLTIKALAELVAEVVGFEGTIEHDLTKADGAPRKLMSGARLAELGWTSSIDLQRGLQETYQWFQTTEKLRLNA